MKKLTETVIDDLHKKLGRNPFTAEIAKELGIEHEKFYSGKQLFKQVP